MLKVLLQRELSLSFILRRPPVFVCRVLFSAYLVHRRFVRPATFWTKSWSQACLPFSPLRWYWSPCIFSEQEVNLDVHYSAWRMKQAKHTRHKTRYEKQCDIVIIRILTARACSSTYKKKYDHASCVLYIHHSFFVTPPGRFVRGRCCCVFKSPFSTIFVKWFQVLKGF